MLLTKSRYDLDYELREENDSDSDDDSQIYIDNENEDLNKEKNNEKVEMESDQSIPLKNDRIPKKINDSQTSFFNILTKIKKKMTRKMIINRMGNTSKKSNLIIK